MGYRIIYGKEKRRLNKGTKKLIITILVSFLLIGFAYFCRPRLPEAALENMVDAVRDGETLTDAISAFCREIIDSAQNYD
jgi:hypothetical protein